MSDSTADLPQAFVPPWLRRELERGPVPTPSRSSVEAATLLVDIVGFTRLTGELGAQGPVGAENLSAKLDDYFSELGRIVGACGGEVATFAGDAIVAVFFADALGGLEAAVEGAIRCGLGVQAQASPLAKRTSIAAGRVVLWTLRLGQDARGVLGGPAVVALAEPHAQARPGEVWLHATAASLTRRPVLPGPAGTARLKESPLAVTTQPPSEPASNPIDLDRWLPRVVRERLAAGQAGWIAEFRTVSVLFAAVPTEYLQLGDPGPLQAELDRMMAVLDRWDGDTLGFVEDEKGATLLGAFGLPGRSRGDDAARAVGAAAALAEGGRAVGVATGKVYTGRLGAHGRRDYGGLGPPMNLAARLMGLGEGASLCPATASAAGSRVSLEPAGLRVLKGLDSPQPVVHPGEAWVPRPAARRVSGRHRERAELREGIRGRAGSLRVRLVGEPGIGKSMILRQLEAELRTLGTRVLAAEGSSMARRSAWHIWRGLASELVRDLSAAEVRARLGDPGLAARAAVLDDLWPLKLGPSTLADQLEPAARAATVREVLVRLLKFACRSERLVLLVDDLQWADSASATLLAELLTRVPRLDVVLGGRGTRPDDTPELTRLATHPALRTLEVGPLSEPEMAQLLADLLEVERVPASLVAMAQARSAGHPYFGEQLALSLRERGAIAVNAGVCTFRRPTEDEALPPSIEAIVTQRIDTLSPEAQLFVKVASVLGRDFNAETVRAVYPGPDADRRAPGWLAELETAALVLSNPDAPHLYSFKHAITCDATYALLLFSQRRTLHRLVAEWYLSHTTERAEWSTLAWHWEHAGELGLAVENLGLAAESAFRAHANGDVVQLLDRAERLTRGAVTREAAARSFLRGAAQVKLAQHAAARASFNAALAGLGSAQPVGLLATAARLVRATMRQAGTLLFGAPREPDPARAELLSETQQGLAEVAYFQQDLPALVLATVEGLNAAERGRDPRVLARALGSAAIAAGLAGLHGLARAYDRRAHAAAAASAHLPTVAYVNLLSAVYTDSVGHWEAAAASNARASELFSELGDRFRTATSLCGEAFNRFARGKFAETTALVKRARTAAPLEGGQQVSAWCVYLEGLLALLAGGPHREVEAELARVSALELQPGDRLLLDALGAGLAAASGRDEEARALASAVLEASRRSPPSNWFSMWALRAAADAAHRAGAPALGGELCWQLDLFAWKVPVAACHAVGARAVAREVSGDTAGAQRLFAKEATRAERSGLLGAAEHARRRLAAPGTAPV